MPDLMLVKAGLGLAFVPFAAFLVWFVKWLAKKTTTQYPKVNLLDLTVEEYILRLLVENRQFRELLHLREKDWEKER